MKTIATFYQRGIKTPLMFNRAHQPGWIMVGAIDGGYGKSSFPICADIEEARWIIQNHPNRKHYPRLKLL